MRICEELRSTIISQYDIIQREKIADLILINFILCLANEYIFQKSQSNLAKLEDSLHFVPTWKCRNNLSRKTKFTNEKIYEISKLD